MHSFFPGDAVRFVKTSFVSSVRDTLWMSYDLEHKGTLGVVLSVDHVAARVLTTEGRVKWADVLDLERRDAT